MEIAIVKYNAGNMFSVVNALKRLGITPQITDEAEQLQKADRVLFPGQGNAKTAMDYLRQHGLDKIITGLRQPVLGICVGQQLLCRHSEEGDTPCLGIFDVDVKKFVPNHHDEKDPSSKDCTTATTPISSIAITYLYAKTRSLRPTIFSPTPQQSIRITSGQHNSTRRRVVRWERPFCVTS